MPFENVDQLDELARALERWHAPDGMIYQVAIAFMPGGPRESSVLVSLDYYGRGGTLVFRKPERPRVAFRMLSDAARLVIGRCAERN